MPDSTFPLVNPRAAGRRVIGAVCALAFLGALVALGVWSGGLWRDRREFTVRIAAATELTKSSPVLLLGQPVGRVRRVAVTEHDGRPVVEAVCWIDGAYVPWMRHGTALVVRSDLMGAPWLDLQPGPASGAALSLDDPLPATIEAGMVDRLLEIQPVLEQLIARVGGLVQSLDVTIGQVGPILGQVQEQLAMTKASLEQVTGLIGDARTLFQQVKDDQARLVAGVAATLEEVNGKLLPGVDASLRESRASVTAAFGELNQTLDVVQARLPGLLDVTQETLANTRDITEATKHTWPFSSYWKRKAKEEAAAAARAQRGR